MRLSKTRTILSPGNIFAYKPEFNVNGKKGYHSLFSFILSFLFYILFLLMAIYFSHDWFFQKNPAVNYTNKSLETLNVTLDQIIGEFKFRSEYELSEHYKEILKKTNKKENEIFELKINLYEDNINPYSSLSKKISMRLDNNYRIRFEETINNITEFEVSGFNDTKKLSELNYTMNRNTTIIIGFKFNLVPNIFAYFKPCERMISRFKYKSNFYYFNSYAKSGFSKDEESTEINHDRPRTMTKYGILETYSKIKLSLLEVIDDRGNIISEISKDKRLQFSGEGISLSENKFIEFTFKNKMEIFNRKYKKIQNVFADVGGIFTSLVTIFKIISDIFNIRLFSYDVINLLFEYESNREIRKKIDLDISQKENKDRKIDIKSEIIDRSKIENISNRNLMHKDDYKSEQLERHKKFSLEESKKNIEMNNLNKCDNVVDKNHNSQSNIKIKQEIEKLRDEHFIRRGHKMFFKKEKDKEFISLNNIEFLKLFLPFKKIKTKELLLKEQIFHIAESKISQYLDVFNFFDLQEDIEKLKSILLLREQKFLFDFMKKRTFNENSEEKYFDDLCEVLIDYKKNKDINNYLTEIIIENADALIKDIIN